MPEKSAICFEKLSLGGGGLGRRGVDFITTCIVYEPVCTVKVNLVTRSH